METLFETAAIFLGLILRIGVPLGVTAILVWVLNSLDRRWQRETQQAATIAAQNRIAPTLFPMLHCWLTKNCPPEIQERCPAFNAGQLPCWQFFRDGTDKLKDECLGCEVFKRAPYLIPTD